MREHFSRIVIVGTLLAALTAACAQPVPIAPGQAGQGAAEPTAQAGGAADPAAAKPGGLWVEASIADVENLNPILSNDNASFAVVQSLFPTLIGADPFSGEVTSQGAMAESWTVSEDGLIWTFTLRPGVTWSDGDPVDAADFKFSYDAIASDKIETPRKDNLQGIKSIETPDPYTVVVTYEEVRCDAINNLGIGWLPSHLYKADFSDIMDSKLNEAPTVSAGPLTFKSWTRDDNVTMERNATYWEGAPYMDGRIIKVVPDPGTQLAQFQNSEIDLMAVQPDQLAAVQGYADKNIFNFQDDGYEFLALNYANPENPQPGLDEQGKAIAQDPHPILSDLRVRKAIAHSLDYQTIIDEVFFGQGYQIASNGLPAISWAYNDALQPYAYNLEMAGQLLEEAGWVDADADGIREKDGKPLALSLITNAGNTTREDLGALAQDQLKQVGFDIAYEAIDFGVLVEKLVGQKFDMVIIGWTGTGTDPNDENLWKAEYDVPDSGFNFVSYQNPKVDELLTQGVTAAGCTAEARAPFYKEIQQLIHADVPYVFVSGGVGNTGYAKRWAGINPGTWSFFYNIHEFYLTQ